MKARSSPSTQQRIRRWVGLALLILTVPVWIPLVVLLIGLALLKIAALYVLAWTWWIGPTRRRVLFVYSDSPHWKDYVEANIVPKLPPNTVVLNWSRRASWSRRDLSVTLFHAFAGDREFNPIGLVFERFRFVGTYRFWQPFRDAKHGRRGPLEVVEQLFLQHAAGSAPSGSVSLKTD
jgi:hypothetical protein